MGWKMTEYNGQNVHIVSQSVFAGYGLEDLENEGYEVTPYLSQSDFAGYGLEAGRENVQEPNYDSRNPLTLDMGWKLP